MPTTTCFEHLARHLQEVSLAVLPQSHNSDSDSEGDSASSQMSDESLLHVPGVEMRSLSPAKSLDSIQETGVQPPETTTMDVVEESVKSKVEPLIAPEIGDTIGEPQPAPLQLVAEKEAIREKKAVSDQGAPQEGNPIPEAPQTKRPGLQPCRYKTGKTLGAGSYSVVKECVHIDTGRYYAAKVINKRLMAGQEHRVSVVISLYGQQSHEQIAADVELATEAQEIAKDL